MLCCDGCFIDNNDWEEIANVATHLLGFCGVTLGLVLFSCKIYRHPRRWRYWGPCLVFTVTVGVMYLASTTFHAASPSWKREALVLDHLGILLALGGTASAYAMLCKPHFGVWHYVLIWSGIVGAVILSGEKRGDPVLLAILASILAIAFLIHMSRPPCPGIGWIWAGVGAYLLGLPFLLAIQIPFAHACWHICVLLGTTLHYIALRSATRRSAPPKPEGADGATSIEGLTRSSTYSSTEQAGREAGSPS